MSVRHQLSVLVVAYNSRKHIALCLDALRAECCGLGVEILLTDNGTDGTAALVEAQFPEITVLPTQGNVGFARANNRLARRASASLLLFVNPDAVIEPGSIDALLRFAAAHRDAAAFGGVSLTTDRQPDPSNAIAAPSLAGLARTAFSFSRPGARTGTDVPLVPTRIPILCGSLMLVRRSAWQALGGFDERFFLYSEEIDFYHRLAERNLAVWKVPAARIVHAVGNGQHHSPIRLLLRAAGQVEYLRKHWSVPKRLAGTALIWFAAASRYGVGRVVGRFRPGLASLSNGYRLVATQPGLWVRGYHSEKGLQPRLAAVREAEV